MIPVFKPSIDEEEWYALKEPLEKGWLGLGPKTREFEDAFAAYVRAPHAIGVNSGTSALHLGFAVLDIAGGEVITTSLTYVATNHAILYCGGIPVFADVEEDTGNLGVDEIERRITPRTKAICVVHYTGHPCDMDPIMEMAARHNLPVLQDSAHACGSKYKGRPDRIVRADQYVQLRPGKEPRDGRGRHGDAAGRRDGRPHAQAALARPRAPTGDARRARRDGLLPRDRGDRLPPPHERPLRGDRHRAAAKAREAQRATARDRRHLRRGLRGARTGSSTPVLKPYADRRRSTSTSSAYRPRTAIALILHLKERGVGSHVHFVPTHLHPAYRAYATELLPVTERLWKTLVTLPLFPGLTEDEIAQVIEGVRSYTPRTHSAAPAAAVAKASAKALRAGHRSRRRRVIRDRDIVCMSFVTWDDHWSTTQQQMSRLARHNRIFFVDQPISPASFFTGIRRRDAVARQFRRWRQGYREVAKNVYAGSPPPILAATEPQGRQSRSMP